LSAEDAMCNASAALRMEPWCATASKYEKMLGGCSRQLCVPAGAAGEGWPGAVRRGGLTASACPLLSILEVSE
jgi:hypothetical protein